MEKLKIYQADFCVLLDKSILRDIHLLLAIVGRVKFQYAPAALLWLIARPSVDPKLSKKICLSSWVDHQRTLFTLRFDCVYWIVLLPAELLTNTTSNGE